MAMHADGVDDDDFTALHIRSEPVRFSGREFKSKRNSATIKTNNNRSHYLNYRNQNKQLLFLDKILNGFVHRVAVEVLGPMKAIDGHQKTHTPRINLPVFRILVVFQRQMVKRTFKL